MIPVGDLVGRLPTPEEDEELSDIEPDVCDVPDEFSVSMETAAVGSLCFPMAAANPLALVESDTARVSVLPVVGSEVPVVYVGKVALYLVALRVSPSCLRMDSEETLRKRDELCRSGRNPGQWTYGGGTSSGTVRACGSGNYPGR